MKTYKVVFVGDSGVGKTSIIKSFIGEDIRGLKTTVGAEIFAFKRDEFSIAVWDFAGQYWFRDILSDFLKGTILAVMVFDLSRPQTLFSLLKSWADFILKYAGSHTLVVVVGNKKDIKRVDDRIIARVLDELKKKLKVMFYIQTSALYNENISKMFDVIFELVRSLHDVFIREQISLASRGV